tara:strand:- start:58 stop:1575 length:1518 start_codon:yes stop_codon:yes gene_type:complete
MESEHDIELRKRNAKKKIESFVNDKYKITLIGIMVFALIVRIYFFFATKDQAHWWDTLAYAGLAKNMIHHLWDANHFIITEAIIRPPLLPIIWAALMNLGVSEIGTILLIEILPSLASVYLMYLIGKELYDEKIGLLSAFFFSIAWIHLFYSMRIMTDTPSLFLAMLSIYFFLKSYEDMKLREFSLSILFLSLAILMRYSHGLIGFAYIIFLTITWKHKVLAKKNFWMGGIIGVIPLIIFFVYNLINSGNIFPATGNYVQSAIDKPAFAYYVIGFMPHIFRNVILGLFILGGIFAVFELFIGANLINKVKKIRSHAFLIILFLVSIIFFVFIIKAAEDRYLMMIFPTVFAFASLFLIKIYNFSKHYCKVFGVLLVILILVWAAYGQWNYGKPIIDSRTESFRPMKEALVWIGENTPEDSRILGQWADPYTIYYAHREVEEWPRDLDNLSGFEPNADYLIDNNVHQPDMRIRQFINDELLDRLTVLQVFYIDDAQQVPGAIIYKLD